MKPQGKPINLTEEEIERKFAECGMPEILKTCKTKSTERDPDVLTSPPYTSVKHKREKGLWHYLPEDTDFQEPIALTFSWEGPDGLERMSIRQFISPDSGQPYKLKKRDALA